MKGRDLNKYQTRGESRYEGHYGGRYGDSERQHPIRPLAHSTLGAKRDQAATAKGPLVADRLWDR
jgi:hypothetical protein